LTSSQEDDVQGLTAGLAAGCRLSDDASHGRHFAMVASARDYEMTGLYEHAISATAHDTSYLEAAPPKLALQGL